ncbi:uncharacterized protein BYT42DRAFT_304294 [Radiomyces spectabilis]|uniref:uncharacterized protein n=1 Tax=Radiomyces spectabilis TaxID=64574 RepID=UPI00221F59DE|nr:uncharacterized protein BYT42DRAFT_304294 [Radiomyces spectabilis]KAI8381405.1 hypothetical protein BYT42DRAFT_304294 [Radiomyces spectabilis]
MKTKARKSKPTYVTKLRAESADPASNDQLIAAFIKEAVDDRAKYKQPGGPPILRKSKDFHDKHWTDMPFNKHVFYYGDRKKKHRSTLEESDLKCPPLNMLEALHLLASVHYRFKRPSPHMEQAFEPEALSCFGFLMEEYARHTAMPFSEKYRLYNQQRGNDLHIDDPPYADDMDAHSEAGDSLPRSDEDKELPSDEEQEQSAYENNDEEADWSE